MATLQIAIGLAMHRIISCNIAKSLVDGS